MPGEKIEELDIDYELKILGAMKSRIKGNPLCHRSGCHGSGVLGITTSRIGGMMKPQLLTCPCAQFGETEYKRLYDETASHDASMRNFFLALDVTLVQMEQRTLLGFIRCKLEVGKQIVRNIWYRFRKFTKPAIKTAGKPTASTANKQTTERPAGDL